jgi:hypothetical protein
MVARKLRRQLRRWWDAQRAPWPLDGECHSDYRPEHSCEQCQPTHVHRWKAWPKAPRWIAGGPGIPVRCTICAARKCDFDNCDSRRHDHIHTHGLALPHIREPKVEA